MFRLEGNGHTILETPSLEAARAFVLDNVPEDRRKGLRLVDEHGADVALVAPAPAEPQP